jgi:hypothetical protein
MYQSRPIFTDDNGERMCAKLSGQLLGRITGDLASRISAADSVVLEIAIITEWIVIWVELEFHVYVDERYVSYDTEILATTKFIEGNVRFDFGFVVVRTRVRMTMRVDKLEAGTVWREGFNLERSYRYVRQA